MEHVVNYSTEPHPAPASSGTSTPAPLAHHISEIMEHLGEDVQREGLRDTPKRYAKAMRFLTSGYEADLKKIVGKAIFRESSDVVVVRDIEMYSLCEHHLLPFFGKVHVAYLPNQKIIGLSKIPRIIDAFARRFQVQERLTRQIAEAIEEILEPLGVAVVVESHHLCMMMRGVQKQDSFAVTSCMLGKFKDDAEARRDVLQLLRK